MAVPSTSHARASINHEPAGLAAVGGDRSHGRNAKLKTMETSTTAMCGRITEPIASAVTKNIIGAFELVCRIAGAHSE